MMQASCIRRWMLPFILAREGSQLTEWPGQGWPGLARAGQGWLAGGERENGLGNQATFLAEARLGAWLID